MWSRLFCCHGAREDNPKVELPKSTPEAIRLSAENTKTVDNNHANTTEGEDSLNSNKTNVVQDLNLNNKTGVISNTAAIKAPRSDGPSVTFRTDVNWDGESSGGEYKTPRLVSITHRPAWTLQDIPGSDEFIDATEDSYGLSSVRLSNDSFRSSNHSSTKLLDEDDTIFTNQSRYSRSGFHTGRTNFMLPRISTDPTASTFSESLDDMTCKPFPVRRGSMIVRSGRTTVSPSVPPGGSISEQTSGMEGIIVTPFAQVLVSLQRIRHAFIRLTSAQSTHRFGVISSAVPEPTPSEILQPKSEDYKCVAMETLEELEWCLKQLENIQTKRPVSDMAFSKFKRLLNKELNSFGETDKSRHEISAYICGTFLEDEKDKEANQEIEQMLERRRSSGQSHGSANIVDQSSNLNVPKIKPGTEKGGLDVVSDGPVADRTNTSVVNVSQKGQDTKDLTVGAGQTMPVNGIVTPNDKELDERFTLTLDTWGADIFEIDRLSNGHALTTTGYRIFQKRDLLRTFSIDPATLVRYLLKVESTYHPEVPYHNALHAADVTQTSHFLLQAEPLEDVFSDLEILAVIFASIIHDVDHPGLTNQFLINSGHDLALQYNDSSVLENHHLYVGFKLLNQPDLDIFSSLGAKKRQTLRRMVIELVLATDMSKHMSLLADLRTMVEAKKVSGSGVLNLDNYSDRMQILQNMIHCADLSNPAKPLRLNRKWTTRLMEEFFRQGDKERSMKLEISPMCDRESVAIEKSQVTFIDFVAHPLLESWCDLVYPSAQLILDILADNRDWYDSQSEGPKTSGASKGRTRLPTAEEGDEESTTTS